MITQETQSFPACAHGKGCHRLMARTPPNHGMQAEISTLPIPCARHPAKLRMNLGLGYGSKVHDT
jgi:hypothetical protein